ncbi:MAG: PD-(D/E)XK nuclease domain-containing protein [Lachnospiraceae bacterium]
MNKYMNYVALDMISVFDVGKRPSEKAPERFYHGLVLGLIVKLRDEYEITSNRESGYGRYDVMMRPKKEGHKGIIIEFKVRDEKREATLEETLQSALEQIEKKAYERELLGSGIHQGQILKYGFAFEGKTVLIGTKNQ